MEEDLAAYKRRHEAEACAQQRSQNAADEEEIRYEEEEKAEEARPRQVTGTNVCGTTLAETGPDVANWCQIIEQLRERPSVEHETLVASEGTPASRAPTLTFELMKKIVDCHMARSMIISNQKKLLHSVWFWDVVMVLCP
jgi:hypothetical protein